MGEKILFVDDDPSILAGFYRQLRQQFEVHTAEGPEAGLDAVAKNGPYAVVVSDLRMPGMDGINFLGRVYDWNPDTVRIMLTGNADLQAAIAAVNEGNIFRFLTKPVSPDTLLKTLQAAVQQYNLITSERVLLQKTLSGSIQVLIDVLSLTNPIAFSRASRIRRYIQRMASYLSIKTSWQFELAALLSQVGCVALDPAILEKTRRGQSLTPQEEEALNSHPTVAQRLLANIPRLESVAEMVGLQQVPFASFTSRSVSGSSDVVNLGAQMLRVALDFDQLVNNGESPEDAIKVMVSRPDLYNPRLVLALGDTHAVSANVDARTVRASDLRVGMKIVKDIRSKAGILLVAGGQEVTESILEYLSYWVQREEVEEPVSVLVPREYAVVDEAA
ncbi:MAG: response regulator [Armatimonadetes bacterium]|nr:response regulator [Armatimonadota bacterium]